jgi:hypothetical protein
MQNQNSIHCSASAVSSNDFVQRHATDVTGILSGWDRMVVRGTLRKLYSGAQRACDLLAGRMDLGQQALKKSEDSSTLCRPILLIVWPPADSSSRTVSPRICLGRPHPLATKALRNLTHPSGR